MTSWIFFRHTGHLSFSFFNLEAHSKQQTWCPESPWMKLALRGLVTQTTYGSMETLAPSPLPSPPPCLLLPPSPPHYHSLRLPPFIFFLVLLVLLHIILLYKFPLLPFFSQLLFAPVFNLSHFLLVHFVSSLFIIPATGKHFCKCNCLDPELYNLFTMISGC